MKTVKKNVYYCEFCKKKGLSGRHMTLHEDHCTMNPDRECRLCENAPSFHEITDLFLSRFKIIELRYTTEQLVSLIDDDSVLISPPTQKIDWIGSPITLEDVRKSVGNCPACILSVMRQCKFHYDYFKDIFGSFDFKTESAAWLSDKNAREDYYANVY